MANPNTEEVLVNGQLAIATIAQSGTIISGRGDETVCALVSTDSGNQLAVKVYDLNGGGGGGGSYTAGTGIKIVDGVISTDTPVVTLTTDSTELATNTIYNGSELASVTITLPDTVPADFIAQVEFTSGSTPTTFTAPAGLYFMGDATSDGVFTPAASHRYCIMVMSDGSSVIGLVMEK